MERARTPRRILVLNERDLRNPLAGGAEVHIFEIFTRMIERGHEVTLLTATFPGCAREEIVGGVRVRRLTNRYLYYAVVGLTARRMARVGNYDLVVDVLNKLPYLSPWLVRKPCFAIVHHLFGTTAFRQVSAPIALVTWLTEKLIPYAYRDTRMLAISPSTKDDLVARGIAADHVWVVPPGLDQAAYSGTVVQSPREPLVLWIGRLEPYKRADLMLAAMTTLRQHVKDARLVFVGEGTARADLERSARELGLEGVVTFTGFVSEEAKIAWLARAAVVVNTSEKEGWGMTVIEGNAFGAPSVSSAVPGLRDSVRDGETGILYPYGDAEALSDALVRLLTDEQLYSRLSAAALEWAERFTWDSVSQDAERLMEEAIAPSGDALTLVASPF